MKAAIKVVRPRRDQGSSCTDEERSKARRFTNFCHYTFVHKDNPSLVKPDSCFLYKGLALKNYNNKAPDDELATVPCLGTEA